MSTDPLQLRDDLREAYLRYFDTAFWLRDKTLLRERRGLLEAPGALLSEDQRPGRRDRGTSLVRSVHSRRCAG
jgi:hypothetical protein